MAMKVCYTVMDGEIISEERGGVESFYVPDALGSTIAITDSSGAVTDRIAYWPYGEIASRTGTSPSPFLFVGTRGYFAYGSLRTYVRARHYDFDSSRWLTVDPNPNLSVRGTFYWYANDNPINYIDPTGLFGLAEVVIIGVIVLVGVGYVGNIAPDGVIWDTGHTDTDSFKCLPTVSNFGRWASKNKAIESTWCRTCAAKCYMHFGVEAGSTMVGGYNINETDLGVLCYLRYSGCMKLLDGMTF